MQLAYAVTVHRVQGLTVDKAIVTLNHNFFASGQARIFFGTVQSVAALFTTGFLLRFFIGSLLDALVLVVLTEWSVVL